MSKKKFEAPKLEITQLEAADIITTSTGAFDGEWVPIEMEPSDGFLIQ